jgi:hypothetical protein
MINKKQYDARPVDIMTIRTLELPTSDKYWKASMWDSVLYTSITVVEIILGSYQRSRWKERNEGHKQVHWIGGSQGTQAEILARPSPTQGSPRELLFRVNYAVCRSRPSCSSSSSAIPVAAAAARCMPSDFLSLQSCTGILHLGLFQMPLDTATGTTSWTHDLWLLVLLFYTHSCILYPLIYS